MNDLILKILNNNVSTEEIVLWLLNDDMMMQKEGCTKTAFARYLLDFIRKKTHLLLPKQEPHSNIPETTRMKPLHTSTPTRTPSQVSASQNSNSVLTPPVYRRVVIENKYQTPPSSSYNSTPTSRMLSPNHPSMELLERRLTSTENSKFSPKPLQLTDFIVTKEKSKKKKRRVKPIPCGPNELLENINVPLPDRTKSGGEFVGKRVTPVSCPMKEWSDHKKEPIKILKRVPFVKIDDQTQQSTLIKNSIIHQPETATETNDDNDVRTEMNLSTEVVCVKEEHKILIQKLAQLYSAVIMSNYSQDLLKELSFLMSLLSSTTKVDNNTLCSVNCGGNVVLENVEKIDLFELLEEGRYFAAVVLEHLWNLLKQLNTATLSNLAQILNTLIPEFGAQIVQHTEKRKNDSENVSIVEREMLSETVKFKMDTDCRPNYVNDQLFYAFKKQRDEFYSLLQEWEEETNKRQNSADFFKAKLKKLRSILTASTASSNMHRLADLFVSQILASVFNEKNENNEKLSVDGITSSKFDLLNRRFLTPSSLVLGNEKRFPGVQEFFKDFLRASSAENSFFFSHVRDVLIQRIISLNNFNISSDVSVTSVRQEVFLACINKLCLLAKFLSLIVFLPYQDKEILPPHLRIPLVDARKHTLPPLDFDYILTQSIETGRILISVPWIVEFLNGIDHISIQLPCYRIVLAKLQYLLFKIKLPSKNHLWEGNMFFVLTDDMKNSIINTNNDTKEAAEEESTSRFSISQLKEIASKTTSDFTKRFVGECLRTMECAQMLITLYINSLFNSVSVPTIINMEDMTVLINLPILISSEFYIDSAALYQCFPQMYELKSVLEGRKRLSYKSVTPKTEKTFCDRQTNEIALDMQLEMHFFDNMLHSVKYTVDIVAKQISSHCVSTMRDKIIPELKTQLFEHMKTALLEDIPVDEVKNVMQAKFYNILRRAVNEELSALYESVESSLKGMLKSDVKEDDRIFNICVDVTCRKCIEMTYNWIFSYISFDSMVEGVEKIVREEVSRLKYSGSRMNDDKKSKKSKTNIIKHDFDTLMTPKNKVMLWTCPGPVKILHRLRHLTRIVIANSNVRISHTDAYPVQNGNTVTVADIGCLIEDAISCIEQRTDLQFIAFRRIMLMSLDLIAMLVFLQPNVIEKKILQLFMKMWTYRKDCKLHLHFEQVLSSRNIEIYSKRTEREQEDIRLCLGAYLRFTLEHKMMHRSRLFRQVLKLLQHEWSNEDLLRPILICVKEALKNCCQNEQKILTALESMIRLQELE